MINKFQLVLLLSGIGLISAMSQSTNSLPLDYRPQVLVGDDGVTVSAFADGLTIRAPLGKEALVRLTNIPSETTKQITHPIYAIEGEVQYAQIEGDGYLEMWSDFGNMGRYFSRTLANAGAMAKLKGQSAWRKFVLPFDTMGKVGSPTGLEINLVLPKGGMVSLRGLRFIQLLNQSQLQDALTNTNAVPATNNTSPRFPGMWWLAAPLAGLAAIWMGLVAVLGRKSLRWALSAAGGGLGFGLVLLVAGLLCPLMNWPFAIFYPLTLGGVMISGAFGATIWKLRQQWRHEELRRIVAMDVG